jgi:hypothetical protein
MLKLGVAAMPRAGPLSGSRHAGGRHSGGRHPGEAHSHMRLAPDRFPQCALVSTAGSLLGQGYGRDIDAHEEVIRLGQGPTGGRYLQDLGSRTTLRIANPYLFIASHSNLSMFRRTLESEGWPRLVYLSQHCPYRKGEWAKILTCIPVPRCAANLTRASKPTTGFSTVVLLLGGGTSRLPPWMPRCSRLHLYGFGDADPSAPYHYWSDGTKHDRHNSTEFYRKTRKTSNHDFMGEHVLLRSDFGATAALDGPFVIPREAITDRCAGRNFTAPVRKGHNRKR